MLYEIGAVFLTICLVYLFVVLMRNERLGLSLLVLGLEAGFVTLILTKWSVVISPVNYSIYLMLGGFILELGYFILVLNGDEKKYQAELPLNMVFRSDVVGEICYLLAMVSGILLRRRIIVLVLLGIATLSQISAIRWHLAGDENNLPKRTFWQEIRLGEMFGGLLQWLATAIVLFF